MSFRSLLAAGLCLAALSGCANRQAIHTGSIKTAYAYGMEGEQPLAASAPAKEDTVAWMRTVHPNALAGRTLAVGSLHDIRLREREVVLTFDDGPMPGKTEKVLDTLDAFGVKATFLMVGQMAETYPSIARSVVARGHSIGSHTYRHRNLASMSFDSTLSEIQRGEKAVQKATATDAAFFRFPYLSDTRRLRSALTARGEVIMDVDVDSKDYFKDGPAKVAERTMAALNRRGRGIILMHDIHKRTATMLPAMLNELKAQGYKVVALRYKRSRMPEQMIASAE